MSENGLRGKVIIVNGGTKGLGRSVAIEAGRRGASIVFGGRSAKDGAEVTRIIQEDHKGTATFVSCDVRKPEECKKLVAEAERKYGRVDGLVNYTGILPACPITDTEESLYDDVFSTNVKSAFFLSKFVIRLMLKTGGGSIVNVGSLHGYGGERDRAAYACSKGALLTLTKHIAKNYAKDKIRANWITMGWVATPGEMELRHSQGLGMPWLEEQARRLMPMGRLQTADDNVPAFIFLLSDDSQQITGTEVHITGGWVL